MLLEELEWKLGGRIKSVLIIVLVILFMWYAGGNHTSAAYAGAHTDNVHTNGASTNNIHTSHPWEQYFSCYIKCWEMLCIL